ncbi:MAG TPA: tetratricopeptide repeat protein [Bacteroidales bacterium]|mgnify:CR=1 FL=1|nr:tetratricopeptide repeat protein [Bacteroidales bacterium]
MAGKTEKKTHVPSQKKRNRGDTGVRKSSFQIPSRALYALLVVTAIIYTRALFNGFASLDDDDYLFKNPYIKDFSFDAIKSIFSSFYTGNYHPLTTLTYLFELHIYGLKPFPYHLLNVLLHLANAWLVYKLAEKLSGTRLTALLVSALFALHPMHVESVAWISERKDVLYTFFYLASLLAYLDYLKSDLNKKHYMVSLLLFLLSLLSKSAAVTLPALMIAIDFYKSRKPGVKMFVEKIPFVALSLLFGILALFSQQGAIKEVSAIFTFFERIFLFTYALAFYLVKIILPVKLSAMHYYPETHGAPLPWYYYASLPLLLLLIWLVVRKTGFSREKLFGASFFLIVISIMLQLIPVGNAITAERYTYVSYIGVFYIAGQWLSHLQKESLRKAALIGFGVFLLAISLLTWNRIKVWENGNTLFTDIIKKYPDSYVAWWMRGNYKNELKDYQGALQDYNKTLQLYPYFDQCLTNRGHILNELKDYKAALRDLDLAIQLDSTVAETFNNRGMAYDGLRDTAAAMKDYNKAILLNPELQKAYNNRGVLKATIGNLQSAITDINKAISLKPDDGEAYSNRANIRAMMKDFKGSFDDYSIALQYNPKDDIVLFNRGLTRLNLNDTAGACEDMNQSLSYGNKIAGEVISALCK